METLNAIRPNHHEVTRQPVMRIDGQPDSAPGFIGDPEKGVGKLEKYLH